MLPSIKMKRKELDDVNADFSDSSVLSCSKDSPTGASRISDFDFLFVDFFFPSGIEEVIFIYLFYV